MSTRTGQAESPTRNTRQVGRRPANVILVGLSGSGKSTVARVLARQLAWRAFDTDQEIRRRTGKAIWQIFSEDGEPAFRELEAGVLQAACARADQVIATGGGAVIDPRNRRLMLAGNLVIFLETKPEMLALRLTGSLSRQPRPLLAGPDLVGRLAELARERVQMYRCAHHVVSTDGRRPAQVAAQIAQLLHARA